VIPGVTFSPRQGGPAAAALSAAAAAETAAATSASFGEFVAWLAEGMAPLEAPASLAGRGRAVGREAGESSPAADAVGDTSAEHAPTVTAPGEATPPSPAVVWLAAPAGAVTPWRSEALASAPHPSTGLASAAAAPSAEISSDPGANAEILLAPTADTVPGVAPVGAAPAEVESEAAAHDPGSHLGTVTRPSRHDSDPSPSVGDQAESAARGRRISRHPHTEAAGTRGQTRAAEPAAVPGPEGRVTAVPPDGVRVRDAAPAAPPAPPSGHGERSTGVLVATAPSAVPDGATPRDGRPAAPPAGESLPQPVVEPSSHRTAESAAAAGLRLRRGLDAAAAPAASPPGSTVAAPGAEPVVTRSPRGADGTAVAGRARDGQAVADC
jgi:hypothetical protein